MASKFLNANTDVNLGTADDQVPSQNAVKTYVDNKKLEDLPDVNITTPSNDQVLKYDSTSQKWINGTGGGSVEIDNKTITENSSNEIQTIATLNQNDITKGLKTWSGTRDQYNNLTTKDPDTIYYINDGAIDLLPYAPPLFTSHWFDYTPSEMSWLRADTFSWHNGVTYSNAYNHLVNDISGITASTETIGSYTVTYYRADDGHKICLADQETTINNIYSSYGIAWYYILDTANTQFKLPRTKYGFEGLRDSAGNIIPESLPNIKGILGFIEGSDNMTRTGPFYKSESVYGVVGSARATSSGQGFDASRVSSAYQDNAPVQERATQMYLYFYVGKYGTTAIEQTAGLNAELFNSKLDLNLGNLPATQTVLTKTDASNLNTTGKAFISGLGMPSTKYTALSLGASGSTYTAPANGWFTLNKVAGGSGRMIQLNNQTRGPLVIGASAGSSGYGIPVIMPALAGDIVKVEYDATGVTNYFGFLYAEGDQD